MSKNVGIVTIIDYDNYGNRLQNYAVQEILKSMGCKTKTILYKKENGFKTHVGKKNLFEKLNPSYISEYIQFLKKDKLYIKNQNEKIIPSIIWKKKNQDKIQILQKKRHENFMKFSEYIDFTDYTISLENYKNDKLAEFDCFVCGSDQVWNPYYPETSAIRFLDFAEYNQKISLSPSFGVGEIPEERIDIFKKWLCDFKHLSVREEQGAEIIKKLTGRNVPVLIDPTLMLTKEEWRKIETKPTFDVSGKYVLTYFLGNEINEYRQFIEKYAKENSCRIIDLYDIRKQEYYMANPSEFVYLIDNAEHIFTDSFHGTVFSILFEKQFTVFNRIEGGKSMSSRIDTLLGVFKIQGKKYNKENYNSRDIEYVNEAILEEERQKTMKYLYSAIYS